VIKNEMHQKVKEAWSEAQDSSDNSNGSHDRENPWNQLPSKSLCVHPSQVCMGKWAIFLMFVAMFVTAFSLP
jgi:hypothetical protein